MKKLIVVMVLVLSLVGINGLVWAEDMEVKVNKDESQKVKKEFEK